MRHWQRYYGDKLIGNLRKRIDAREWKELIREVVLLLQYYPRGLGSRALRKFLELATRSSKRRVLPSQAIGRTSLVELTADLNLKGKRL